MLATFLLLGFLQASLTAESFEELLARGLRLLDQQQWQEAEAAFRKATKLEPQAPSPQVELSRLYLKQGKPELALTALDEALRWSRGDFIILYLRGQALLQLGHYPEATLELEAALVKRPGDKACLTALAQAFLRSGEPARALEILATPVISENSNTLVHALRSLALAQLGHIEEAEAFLNQAKESEHPPWVLLYVGRTELALGRPIEAAESFRKGRQLDGPFVFDFTLALTEAALDRGDSVEARRLLTPLLSSNPNRSESWFLMGLVEIPTLLMIQIL